MILRYIFSIIIYWTSVIRDTVFKTSIISKNNPHKLILKVTLWKRYKWFLGKILFLGQKLWKYNFWFKNLFFEF